MSEGNQTGTAYGPGQTAAYRRMTFEERSSAINGVMRRLDRLRGAIDQGGDFFDPFLAARAKEEIASAEERVRAGMGVTVAALAGGTGSGKSTLFNALSGLSFADAGELRPTTEQASACVWNADADAVLDMIGVHPSRRIDYHSILTEGKHDLDSLILLDLPDHDSVEVKHSVLVDQALPLVDILIWVLDPQKYADHLIHESYLSAMRERRDHMIVVVNQVDTVPEGGLPKILDDVKMLLERDGLKGIPVFPVSALNRTGIDPVLEALRTAIQGTESVIATTQAELDGIRRRLSASVGVREPELEGEVFNRITNSLVEATGAPAVAQSLRQAGYTLGETAIATADQPAASMVVATRDSWIAHVKSGLPDRWQEAVTKAIPDPERIRRTVGGAVRQVSVPSVNRWFPIGLMITGIAIGVAAVVLAAFGIPEAMGPRVVLGVVGGALAIGSIVLARSLHARAGRRAAQRYEADAVGAIRSAVERMLVEPAEIVLARHRQVRESLQV